VEAPDAVPRAKESVAISLRLPIRMVAILKEFARRAGIGYQVLMKRWLHERIEQERQQRRTVVRLSGPVVQSVAAVFNSQGAQNMRVLTEAARYDDVGRIAKSIPSTEEA
jgi:hypothetical protein